MAGSCSDSQKTREEALWGDAFASSLSCINKSRMNHLFRNNPTGSKGQKHLPSLKMNFFFTFFLFGLLLKVPAMLQAKQRAAAAPAAEEDPGCLTLSRLPWIWAEGILQSPFLVDSGRQDPTFRCAVLKEPIKSSGNYVVFIKCELGTAPEHSISIEPADSKQLPFPQSFLLFFVFCFSSVCLFPSR